MTAKRKITALILAAVILLAVAASLFIIIHEADHDCSGEDCPVCALIEACTDTIRSVSLLIAVAIIVSSAVLFAFSGIYLQKYFCIPQTPVSLKIKLLN